MAAMNGVECAAEEGYAILVMLRHLPAVEVEAVGEAGTQRDQVVAGLGVWIGYAWDGYSARV